MKPAFVFCLALFFWLKTAAQDSLSSTASIIKWTPLKAVGVVNPSIELSFEQFTGRRWSTSLTGAWMLPGSIPDIGSPVHPDASGYMAGLEQRYYFVRSNWFSQVYSGLQLQYRERYFTSLWEFGSRSVLDTGLLYEDTFRVSRRHYTINAVLGTQFVWKRFVLDIYGGLGLRHRAVTHSDRRLPGDVMAHPRHPGFVFPANKEGSYWTVSVPLNIRIGWQL